MMNDITGKTLDELEADGYFDKLTPRIGDTIVTCDGYTGIIVSLDANNATAIVKFPWELLTWRQKLKAFVKGSW